MTISNDETQLFIKLLIEELNKRSEQCPGLKQYVFCVEGNQWTAKPKHPLPFDREEGYYVRNLRMLVETGLTCEQIGWDCGFTSYHYFKRVFEKYYQVSPKRFRTKL